MTLPPREIKTSENCGLPNSFGSAQTSSQHLRKFLGTFGSVLKIVGNLRMGLGRFRKSLY